MTNLAIAANGLRKSYGDKVVLDGGTVQVAGHDLVRRPDDVRGAIGVTGQYSAVDKLLTGEENLLLMADLKHLSRRDGKRKAAELADRIALLDHGRLIAEGTAEELKRRIPGGHIELTFADTHLLDTARHLIGAGIADPEALTLQVPSDGGVRAIRELLALLDERSIDIDDMSVHTPDLDDVFLTLTGQQKEATR
ncbi:hypothetical protein [Streptosporangium roseum]|uniref:hypothetical protein n=1 Tax=Streptosporangium roseum TaxID=2001 RepID=UPI003329F5C9